MALAAMTLALGRRVLVVDGVERWRGPEVEKQLAPLLAQMPPATTLAMFAREEARAKTPEALVKAIKEAGGSVREHATVKGRALPKWVEAEAKSLGLALDAAAARMLVARVGERQQRLLRELEKIALATGGGRVSAEQVDELAAQSAERPAYELADALIAGEAEAALRIFIRLWGQGERLSGLIGMIARRASSALRVAGLLQEDASPARIREELRPMAPWMVDRLISEVRRGDPARLRTAVGVLADLELRTHGGSQLPAGRDAMDGLGEDSLALRAIELIAA
jgi:DNA polymerase-3 subunit delta